MKTTLEITDPSIDSAKPLDQQNQITFDLKNACVHGQHILIADPFQWQQMEEDYVTARVMKPLA